MFAGRGVEIVLLEQVSGWFRNKLTEPDDEAELVANYFQDFLGLPVTVGVEFRVLERRERDGRIIRPRTNNMSHYLRGRAVVLVRKNGTIGVSSVLTPDREAVWRAALDGALRE